MYNFTRVISSLALSLCSLVIALAVPTAANASTYYLAPSSLGGSDSHTGLSSSVPWLTPNHAVNCGDTIIALPSTAYSAANFNAGKWGTVNCSAANNVAWLQCQTFDACKIYSTTEGIYVDHSFWGVQGWEVSVTSGTSGFCFSASPNYSSPSIVHHVIFANNVANGCQAGGMGTFNVGANAGADYLAFIGNVIYNAAQSTLNCNSGISIYQPVQSDSNSGTHIYIGGNFIYHNFQPSRCGGVQAWGGDGIILDTLDGSAGLSHAYTAQVAIDNNIAVGNGGYGLEVQNNVAGSVHASVYETHNTVYGNEQNTAQQSSSLCSEVLLNSAYNVQQAYNLVATANSKACAGASNTEYALSNYTVNGTDWVYNNFVYGVGGQNTFAYNYSGFGYASNNVMGQSPNFVSPVIPGAPVCNGTGSTAACMATLVNDFKATNSAANGTGYQTPVSGGYNPVLPKWICTVNLPSGLITKGC